jgi:hypothetical protein
MRASSTFYRARNARGAHVVVTSNAALDSLDAMQSVARIGAPIVDANSFRKDAGAEPAM